jgi:hypothetical protein
MQAQTAQQKGYVHGKMKHCVSSPPQHPPSKMTFVTAGNNDYQQQRKKTWMIKGD